MRRQHHYRIPPASPRGSGTGHEDEYWARNLNVHSRLHNQRRKLRAARKRSRRDRYIAFDAGEPGTRRYGQRWRHYLDRIRRLGSAIGRPDDLGDHDETEPDNIVSPVRRITQRYKEPIIGAAIAGATLPFAFGATGGTGPTTSDRNVRQLSRADLPGHPIARSSTEEMVGERLANVRSADLRAATIDGAALVYGISHNLASMIHDAAVNNDIEPELAFGLVKTESAFDHRAVSNVGARGLTQVMPRTAKWLRPGTTIEDLYNRQLNLNMGFGYLRDLIDKYNGNIRLALLAYNRGPGTVDRVLDRGLDPDNGYADLVLEGYTDLS